MQLKVFTLKIYFYNTLIINSVFTYTQISNHIHIKEETFEKTINGMMSILQHTYWITKDFDKVSKVI